MSLSTQRTRHSGLRAGRNLCRALPLSAPPAFRAFQQSCSAELEMLLGRRQFRLVRTIGMAQNFRDLVALQGDTREPHIHIRELVFSEDDLCDAARDLIDTL